MFGEPPYSVVWVLRGKCNSLPVAAEVKREDRSVTFRQVQPVAVIQAAVCDSEAISSLGKPFFFCLGDFDDGVGALVMQEGCEFAEELLHKENVPHCLGGNTGCQVFFHPLILFLNDSESDSCFSIDIQFYI